MPSAVARDVILPLLPEFLRAHPALEIELSSTDRRVDLIREGFDCVLRVGVLGNSSHIARPLGYYRMVNCASPDYVAHFGSAKHPDELAGHRLIHYVSTLGARDAGFEYVDPDNSNSVKYIAMDGTLTVNNSDAYLSACLAGLGIIQVPEAGVRAALDIGQLVELMPQYRVRRCRYLWSTPIGVISHGACKFS